MVKTAVLVSGGGRNLQALIDAVLFEEIKNCELSCVIASSPDAYAMQRAKNANIPAYVVDVSLFPNQRSFTEAILHKLSDLDIELVVLAGFNYALTAQIISAYPNRIIDVHPSLLPAFCGTEFYDLHVHEAVLERGAKISGATAYFVNGEKCEDPIIAQKPVEVYEDDTPETLQKRVMEEAEWITLVKAVSLYCEGRLEVTDNIVHIKN